MEKKILDEDNLMKLIEEETKNLKKTRWVLGARAAAAASTANCHTAAVLLLALVVYWNLPGGSGSKADFKYHLKLFLSVVLQFCYSLTY